MRRSGPVGRLCLSVSGSLTSVSSLMTQSAAAAAAAAGACWVMWFLPLATTTTTSLKTAVWPRQITHTHRHTQGDETSVNRSRESVARGLQADVRARCPADGFPKTRNNSANFVVACRAVILTERWSIAAGTSDRTSADWLSVCLSWSPDGCRIYRMLIGWSRSIRSFSGPSGLLDVQCWRRV